MTWLDDAAAIEARLPAIREVDVRQLIAAVRDLWNAYHLEYDRTEELVRELVVLRAAPSPGSAAPE